MNLIDRGVKLRAHEIARTTDEPISLHKAFEMALRERFGDNIDALYEASSRQAAKALSDLKKSTHELPEPRQGTLFNPPEIIVVSTNDGDLIVPRAQATLGQVKQWQREGRQRHTTQQYRFTRFGKDLDLLGDLDDDTPWEQARSMLADLKRDVLESGE